MHEEKLDAVRTECVKWVSRATNACGENSYTYGSDKMKCSELSLEEEILNKYRSL